MIFRQGYYEKNFHEKIARVNIRWPLIFVTILALNAGEATGPDSFAFCFICFELAHCQFDVEGITKSSMSLPIRKLLP